MANGEMVVTGVMGLIIISISIVLLSGKGAFLVAGYNTMTKKKKEEYDGVALSRFIGKVLLIIGILTPTPAIADLYGIEWLTSIYEVALIVLVIGALIYGNTRNRFKKNVANK